MRRLKRNQRSFTYYLYQGMTDEVDKSGFKTGRKVKTYADGVSYKGLICYRGKSSWKPYGVTENYSVEIIPNEPIPVTIETKITIGDKTYYVVACPSSKNEQVLYCK